jgi:hypothetical protein
VFFEIGPHHAAVDAARVHARSKKPPLCFGLKVYRTRESSPCLRKHLISELLHGQAGDARLKAAQRRMLC